MNALSPFVYWAQSEDTIFLNVDLKNVKDPDVILEDRKLIFAANGFGANGLNKYAFSIDFNADVDPEASNFKVKDSRVDFTIQKIQKGWWSRLTAQPSKKPWLKIDFEKWKSDDPLLDDDDEDVRDVREDYPDVYKKLQKEEKGYSTEDWKKVYLKFYNFVMFVGYLYILTVIGIRFLRDGADSYEGTYGAVGSAMVLLQLFQFLEILHPIFGYTKTSIKAASMQVIGRFIVLIMIVDSEPRMQTKPVIFYLFFTWTSIEVFRYPYYLTQLLKKENGFLTWLRYTIWIPLYPLGFICEGVIVLRAIPYFEETLKYSAALPNKYNFIFSFPALLKIYLLLFFLPSLYVMMSHMYKMRVKKLGPKKWQRPSKRE